MVSKNHRASPRVTIAPGSLSPYLPPQRSYVSSNISPHKDVKDTKMPGIDSWQRGGSYDAKKSTVRHVVSASTPKEAAAAQAEPAESATQVGLVIFGMGMGAVLILVLFVLGYVIRKLCYGRGARLQITNSTPGLFADQQQEEENIRQLPEEEQSLYKQAKVFLQFNPPDLSEDLSISQYLMIEEKGIGAWDFIPSPSLPPSIITVENKLEIAFKFASAHTKPNYPCSIQSNLPIPRQNDVTYFEAKIFDLPSPENTQLSIGLATRPYPFFRLPGRHPFSISYDINGSRRFNNSFAVSEKEAAIFPKIEKGDVVGVGYRTRNGTVFFTRNGKKLSERKIGGHIKSLTCLLYPTIGASNNCSVHMNIGQLGYVFIEANVKKWGFASVEGSLPPPPAYGNFDDDVLLETGSDTDDCEILSGANYYGRQSFSDNLSDGNIFTDQYVSSVNTSIPTSPPPFWASNVSFIDNITLDTLDSPFPPGYGSEEVESHDGENYNAIEIDSGVNGDAADDDNATGSDNAAESDDTVQLPPENDDTVQPPSGSNSAVETASESNEN